MSKMSEQMRNFLGLSLVVLISSCASTEIKTVGPPLTGDEVRKLIVGNTVQGPMGREPYDWYYQADGQVTGVIGAADDDSGTWLIKGSNVYCHEWDQYFDGVQHCYEWYKENLTGHYLMRNVDADRTSDIEVWKVRQGNPFDM